MKTKGVIILMAIALLANLSFAMVKETKPKPAKDGVQITQPTKKELERVNKEKPKLKRTMPRAYA